MNRTARLDGTSANDVAPPAYVKPPWNITRDELLSMREQGMTNAAIARAINSKAYVIEREIGKTPVALVRQAQREAGRQNVKKAHAAIREKGKKKHSPKAMPLGAGITLQKLKPTITSVRLEGGIADYNVQQGVGTVEIIKRGGQAGKSCIHGTIAFDHLEDVIEELMEVLDVVRERG